MRAELREVRVKAGGRSLRALVAGAGPAVLLLHGSASRGGPLPGPAELWRALAGELSDRHQVIALDLPGVGGSPADTAQLLSAVAAVTAVADVLTELGLEEAHLVAHDEAGLAALELARRDDRVASCALIAPAAIAPAGDRQMNVALLNRPLPFTSRRSLVWTVRRLVGQEGCLDTDLFDLLERETLSPASRQATELRASARAAIELSDARELTSLYAHAREDGVAVPVSIVWGALDPLSTLERAMLLHDILAGGPVPPTIHALAGCGHLPHLEAPAACAAIVSDQVRYSARHLVADPATNGVVA
ncbi:MAG: alpha/beta fold hydrolase [Actinobacteria bacterium]|nr:alpha/beta fold hydrolase [Actinomycetota bacterium]